MIFTSKPRGCWGKKFQDWTTKRARGRTVWRNFGSSGIEEGIDAKRKQPI